MKKFILAIAVLAFVSFTINAQTPTTEKKAPATEKKAPVAAEKKAPVAEKKAPVAEKKAPAPKKTIIDVTKLPKEILDNIKTHQGFKAVKAWSVTENGVLTYVVTDNKVNYFYDKDKKFVKEEAVKETPKTTKPAVKKEEPKKAEVKKEEPKKAVETKPTK